MITLGEREAVRNLLRSNVSERKIAARVGVCRSTVTSIRKNMVKAEARKSVVRGEVSRCVVCGSMVEMPCKGCEMKEADEPLIYHLSTLPGVPDGFDLDAEHEVRLKQIQQLRTDCGDPSLQLEVKTVELLRDWPKGLPS